MEFAYDHIQEEIVAQDTSSDKGKDPEKAKESLNEEFQEAYNAFSASPWGARVGSFIGTVKKQGELYYETGKKEAVVRAEQASKGFNVVRSEIVNRTRSLSITQGGTPPPPPPPTGLMCGQQTGETSKDGAVAGERSQQEEGLLSKLRKGAAQKISAIEAAEARADEYLLRFGANIGNFLKEAVTIRPPESEEGLDGDKKELVFDQKEGKRKIYSTRLDAQLHLLHGNLELFKTDSNETSFLEWSRSFSANGRTAQIAADLDKYPDLRSTMEKLVPDSVQYTDFWRRYYFLRNELDMEEQKRKELLKGATLDEEEVGWDEDDEDESDAEKLKPVDEPISTTSTAVPVMPETSTGTPMKKDLLGPKSSVDRESQPDSELGYDIVSKTPSQATSSSAVAKVANRNGEGDNEKEDGDDIDGGDEEEEEEEAGSDWE